MSASSLSTSSVVVTTAAGLASALSGPSLGDQVIVLTFAVPLAGVNTVTMPASNPVGKQYTFLTGNATGIPNTASLVFNCGAGNILNASVTLDATPAVTVGNASVSFVGNAAAVPTGACLKLQDVTGLGDYVVVGTSSVAATIAVA